MAEKDNRLREASNELNDHILAVKGTLELVEASVSEEDLRDLLSRAIERMEVIQRLSNEMIVTLNNFIEKMSEIKSKKQ
ncbi:MAG: hypothetical protein AB1638_06270 [Nitrospirota bacterium]